MKDMNIFFVYYNNKYYDWNIYLLKLISLTLFNIYNMEVIIINSNYSND